MQEIEQKFKNRKVLKYDNHTYINKKSAKKWVYLFYVYSDIIILLNTIILIKI